MNGIGDRPKLWSSDHLLYPSETMDREAPFKDFGSSMNAISLGFVATTILIPMFLIMAIFEHLLSPRTSIPSSQNDAQGSLGMGQTQAHMQSLGKILNLHHVGEVGELSEIFMWRGEVARGLPNWEESDKEHLGEELSDVLLYLIRLADTCDIDLGDATLKKIVKNAVKYPPKVG